MPTDPKRPRRRPADDDVYVVDTRAPGRQGSPKRPAATPSRRPARGDDAYVVDTRPQQGRPSQRPPATPAEPRYRVRKGRVAMLLIGLLVLGWLAFTIWVPVAAWNGVSRVDNVPDGERPENTSGYTYLLVGSDSREGLTKAERRKYKTGNAAGDRTDTIMLVHVSESGGKPVMISIPRDSYVPIPGKGTNKINAAYSWGGPKLLTETIENVTGIHVDGYLEIGLGGFADVVDALGGVDICVPRNMKDKLAGIDLKKGCQTLNGGNALGYVRSRYEDPLGDIGRANRQRQFLGALMKKAATPSTVLLPWRYKGFVDSAAAGVRVGEETGLSDAYRILMAMRSVSGDEGLSLTVPISDMALQTDNAGLAVKWDTELAKSLFKSIKDDEPLTEAPEGTTKETQG